MRMNWAGKAVLTAGLAVLNCAAAGAQSTVAASVYGAFSGTTNGNGTAQSPSNAAGGIFELRHIRNPLIGYEATYQLQPRQPDLCGNVLCLPGRCCPAVQSA